jgi:hypothetical protein
MLSINLFAQHTAFKAGIGFSAIYQTDEVKYYWDKLNHDANPSFILSYRINWHLCGDWYLAWEPGIVEKSGKVTGLAYGLDVQNNDLYMTREYKLWNLENSLLLNCDITSFNNIMMNIYFGPGMSWNVSEKQQYTYPSIPRTKYTDYPFTDSSEDPYFNNTGPYLNAGVNFQYIRFQFDVRFIKELSDLRVNEVGRNRSFLFFIMIGYEVL